MSPQLEALRQRKEVLDRLAVLVAKGTAAKAKLLRKVIASAEATAVQLAKFGVPAPQHPRELLAAHALLQQKQQQQKKEKDQSVTRKRALKAKTAERLGWYEGLGFARPHSHVDVTAQDSTATHSSDARNAHLQSRRDRARPLDAEVTRNTCK